MSHGSTCAFAPLLDFLIAKTFSFKSLSRSSLAVSVGERICPNKLVRFSRWTVGFVDGARKKGSASTS